MRRVAMVALLFLTACGGGAGTGSGPEPTASASIEYKLAVIDGDATPSDETMRRYGRALDLLEQYCPEDRECIADMTVRSQQLLRDENIDESLLDLLQNFRASIPEEASPGELGDCAGIFAAYVSLRVGSNQ